MLVLRTGGELGIFLISLPFALFMFGKGAPVNGCLLNRSQLCRRFRDSKHCLLLKEFCRVA